MSTAITPEKVAESLTGYSGEFFEEVHGWLSFTAEGNILSIEATPAKETAWGSDEDKDAAVHFRAVVVKGDQAPIVASRPDLANENALQGPRIGEQPWDYPDGWSVHAANHVTFGGCGEISFAEARRFGAALIALADRAEAQAGGETA